MGNDHCAVALGDRIAASTVKAQPGEHGYGLRVALDQRVERRPLALGEQRVDEHEMLRRLVGDRTDVLRPVARTSQLGVGFPRWVQRCPAMNRRRDLLHAGEYANPWRRYHLELIEA